MNATQALSNVKSSNSILKSIGNTPLVKLEKIVPNKHVTILVKCEFANPSGNVKDRIVDYIIADAEQKGCLKKLGGTIVENTSGNTGAAIAMLAAVKGYRAILTMLDKVSQEKQNSCVHGVRK